MSPDLAAAMLATFPSAWLCDGVIDSRMPPSASQGGTSHTSQIVRAVSIGTFLSCTRQEGSRTSRWPPNRAIAPSERSVVSALSSLPYTLSSTPSELFVHARVTMTNTDWSDGARRGKVFSWV